jgi:RNA polymerase sigma factor (sigma-70 family)
MSPIAPVLKNNEIPPAAASDVALDQAFVARRTILFRVARRMLHDNEDAEDCVQETFLRGVRFWSTRRGESSVATWLHAICVNCALEMLRKRRARPETVSLEAIEGLRYEPAQRSYEPMIIARLILVHGSAILTPAPARELRRMAAGEPCTKRGQKAARHRIRQVFRRYY